MNSNPINQLPNSLELIAEAKEILAQLMEWTPGKIFTTQIPAYGDGEKRNFDVSTRTCHTDLNNDRWVARSTSFDHLPSDVRKELLDKLSRFSVGSTTKPEQCHYEYEQHYIHQLQSYEIQPKVLEGQGPGLATYLAKLIYKFGFPLTDRVFYELLHVVVEENALYVIQLATDPSLYTGEHNPKAVLARYTLVERITHLSESLNWEMATASTAGGVIPKAIVNMTLPGAISKDVPLFFEWVANKA